MLLRLLRYLLPTLHSLIKPISSLKESSSTSGWFALSLLLGFAAPMLAQAQQEVSVDKFTGTANVNIPLGSVAIQGASLDVSLRYTAAGMQADDQGGFTGVGWALSGIPNISREVRGLPDDYSNARTTANNTIYPAHYGWLMPATQARVQALAPSQPAFSYPLTVSSSCGTGAEQQAATIVATFESTPNTAATSDQYDSEPDIFSYNVPGHSGRFVFDQFGRARTMPFDPITISYDASLSDSLGLCIHRFTIVTPDGITYAFGAPDIIHKNSALTKWVPSATNPNDPPSLVTVRPAIFQRDFYYYRCAPNQTVTYAAAWHVSSIQNRGGETINFAYYKRGFHDAHLNWEPSAVLRYNFIPEYNWVTKRGNSALREITGPTTFIRFLRTDSLVYNNPAGLAIQSMLVGHVTSRAHIISKTISFTYDLVAPVYNMYGTGWTARDGTGISGYANGAFVGWNSQKFARRFLRAVSVSTACGAPLAYKFRYRAVSPGPEGQAQSSYECDTYTTIPPPGGAFRDYWGFLRFDTDQGWDAGVGTGPYIYHEVVG